MQKCAGFYGTPEKIPADIHVIFLINDDALFKKSLDVLCPRQKALMLGLRENGDFSGKDGEILPLILPEDKYIFVGLGDKEKITTEAVRRASARSMKQAEKFAAATVAIHCLSEEVNKKLLRRSFDDSVQTLAEGALLGLYKYEKYITKQPEKRGQIRELKFVTAEEGYQGTLKTAIETTLAIVEGVDLARNLTNAPSNEVSPEFLAKEAAAMGKKYNLKVTTLGKKEIELHKMGGLLAVNRGSRKEPRFLILEYNEGKRRLPVYVLVGKGVTFDSGGISIKPAAGMEDMKMDMAGAAAVLGVLHAIAKLKLPVRVVGLIPATDNMSGGDALCPGDIIRISNGKSVEVTNTDAEGRLILADALVYAQRYKPHGIIDIATLTGACVIALASHATGMMGNDSNLKELLKNAGEKSSERVWELPLYEEFDEMLKSSVADIKNVGPKWGGAITAAAFLKSFVGEHPWVHLDIAGTAILEEATDYAPKGGSGVGVRLLTEFFRGLKA
jgi:leucyl aminopeptidase